MPLTESDRLSIIEQLALVTKYSTDYYQKFSDKELEAELEKHFGEVID